MKLNYWLPVVLLFASLGCSKKSNPDDIPTVIPPIVDPVSWNPELVQTNTNAMQFNYGRVTLTKGMSGILTNLSATLIGSYSLHVYLKATNGSYLHLPNNSINGVAYSYYQKTANPSCTLFVNRTTGINEDYDAVIVLAAKLSYLQSLSASINFDNFGTAKTKLGF